MDIVVNNNIEITNPELKKVTSEIRKASANVIGNTFKIAYLISKVNSESLYESDGFNDVFEYVKTCFGLEKTSAYNLIKVGDSFIESVKKGNATTFETLLTHGDKDYSISQVFKMLPLGIEKAKELTHDGVIDETMSCRQIERIVKENTTGTSARGKSKDEPETEPETEPDNEDSIIQCHWDDIPDALRNWFKEHYHFENWDDIREIDIV